MRVFVAGGTGVIGRPLVGQLVGAGHYVVAMTRSADKANEILGAGAEPVVADVFDVDAVRAAVADARCDVVLNELTALPREYDPRRFKQLTAPTNDLRRRATANLLDASRKAGVRRLVCQSNATFYERSGAWIRDESSDFVRSGPAAVVEVADALRAMERAVRESPLETVILRYGQLYGPGTWFAPGESIAKMMHKRQFPIVGDGDGVFSFVHVDDAARATVAAIDGPAGTYNVTDDEPAPLRDWLPVYAQSLGAKNPMSVPPWLARMLAGTPTMLGATVQRGASNAKARSELSWTPRFDCWRTGFHEG